MIRSTHGRDAYKEIDGLGTFEDISLRTLTLAGMLQKTTELDAMLAHLCALLKQSGSSYERIMAPLFEATGRVSPELFRKVYASIGDSEKSRFLDDAVLDMAQHYPEMAPRLLQMLEAKGPTNVESFVVLPIIAALGKQDQAAALALAKAQPENVRRDAMLAAATFQPKATAVALTRQVFAADSNRAMMYLAKVNAIDPELAKALYADCKAQQQPGSDSFDTDEFNACVDYAHSISSVDPLEARLIIETQYARALSMTRHGGQFGLGDFPRVMCSLDLDRALAMDAVIKLLDPIFAPYVRQSLMQYVLMSREERASSR